MRNATSLVLSATAVLAGCATPAPPKLHASAALEARSGSAVAGRVDLEESGGSVTAHVVLTGLAPGSEHGFHVHEKGDCSAPDASSAGGHFNPGGQPHGGPGDAAHHAGDLPSVTADAAGKVNATFPLSGVTLAAGPNSLIGRSLVVHRDKDDRTTQPSGNSGPRLACGVITGP
jgi:superoxide dismutase, Cu-Zn family